MDHFCYCGLNDCIEAADQIMTTRVVQGHPESQPINISLNTVYCEEVCNVDWC